MTPEKILSMLPKIKCPIIWARDRINKCHTCSGCRDQYKSLIIEDCANALAGKVVAKEDLLTEDEKYKIISPLLPSGISRGDVLRICKALDEAQQRKENRGKEY
jgi:hypothetical protein